MQKPTMIQIESSTACDAKCVYCPHSQLKRKGGQMPDETFEKILIETKQLGITEVLLFLNGEPLLFNRLFDWLEKLRQGNFSTTIFTNANALTAEKARKLVSYNDVIQSIVFSLAGVDETSYREIMGLSYGRVKRNVEGFIAVNDSRIPVAAHIPYFSKTVPFLSKWHSQWGEIIELVAATSLYNYAGLIHDELEHREDGRHKRAYCERLNHLTILHDGTVCLCCMDAEGQVTFGNVNNHSLMEIFNSDAAIYYREMHIQGLWDTLKLCKDCNMNII